MKIERKMNDRIGFSIFIEKHNLVLKIDDTGIEKYRVRIKNCEIKDGCLLKGMFEDGKTIISAVIKLINNISNKLIVYKAGRKLERKEINIPELYLDEKTIREIDMEEYISKGEVK